MVEKKKSPVLKIVLIVVGALVAAGVVVGVTVGLNVFNQVSKTNDYRTAVNEVNSLIMKYNELMGLESISLTDSTDTEAVKTAAANDVVTIRSIVDTIKQKMNSLESERVFGDTESEAAKLFETLKGKTDAFLEFYETAIEAYKLKATGDFQGAINKMSSVKATADSAFVTALNAINQHLVKKANNQ